MKKQKKASDKLIFILMIVIGAFFGLFLAYYFDKHDGNLFVGFLAFLFLGASVVLQIFFHELGHLIGGLLSGYQFLSFRLFSICLVYDGKQLKWVKMKVPGTLGQCLLIPTKDYRDFKYSAYLLGGIVANIIVSLISLLFIREWFIFVLIFMFVGFIFALSNGIPTEFNDGKTYQLARESKANEYLLWLQLAANGDMTLGAIYNELPNSYFDDSKQVNNYLGDFQQFLILGRHYENEEWDLAKSLLEKMWNRKSEVMIIYQWELKKELLYYLLMKEPNDVRIKSLLEDNSLKKYLKLEDISNHRVLAVIAYVFEEDLVKAEALIDEGIHWSKPVSNEGAKRVEIQLLREMSQVWYKQN